MPGSRVRDCDALESLPDAQIASQDAAYLEKHQIDKLFGHLLEQLIRKRPAQPVQWLTEALRNPDFALQPAEPPSVGLSASSRESLQHVFERMDKRKTGRISYADFKDYAGSSGVQTLSEGELKSIFGDFSKTEVDVDQFTAFFEKAAKGMNERAMMDMAEIFNTCSSLLLSTLAQLLIGSLLLAEICVCLQDRLAML
eukprot:jgi/Astpho2/4650/Aster-x1229